MVLDDRHINYLIEVDRGKVTYNVISQKFKREQDSDQTIPIQMLRLGMVRLVAERGRIVPKLTSRGENTLLEEYEAWA